MQSGKPEGSPRVGCFEITATPFQAFWLSKQGFIEVWSETKYLWSVCVARRLARNLETSWPKKCVSDTVQMSPADKCELKYCALFLNPDGLKEPNEKWQSSKWSGGPGFEASPTRQNKSKKGNAEYKILRPLERWHTASRPLKRSGNVKITVGIRTSKGQAPIDPSNIKQHRHKRVLKSYLVLSPHRHSIVSSRGRFANKPRI